MSFEKCACRSRAKRKEEREEQEETLLQEQGGN